MATLQTLDHFPNVPEVRPLSSAGITRLPRYYGPVRHPTRPSLSLAGVQLAFKPPLGFPVLRSFSLCRHASATTPAGWSQGLTCSPDSDHGGLPPMTAGSAPASTFSRPARRSLTLWPACSRHRLAVLSIEGSGSFVTSATAPIATGWSNSCQVGIAPTEERHLFTAHGHPGFRTSPRTRFRPSLASSESRRRVKDFLARIVREGNLYVCCR